MRRYALLALLLSTGAIGTMADTVALVADRDNTLFFDSMGTISNGAGERFFVGRVAVSAQRRGLIHFPVASVVPAWSHVVSVTLHLNMSRTITGPTTIGLYRTLADWGEGTSDALDEEGAGAASTINDATWIHRFYDSSYWVSPGGDFAATASAACVVDDIGGYVWGSTPELVADVQGWLDSPAGNFGWTVVGDESEPAAKRFDTRENVDPLVRPLLTIEYTPPCVGDLNHDGSVGISDLAIMLSNFGSVNPPEPSPADLDHDGDVDLNDLSAMLARFGMLCS